MKKLISTVAALSIMLSCFGMLSVHAAEEPTIYYSVDKSKWYELPASDFTREATVNFATGSEKTAKLFVQDGKAEIDILDKVQFIYLYAEAPEGATCDFYTTIDTTQNQEPWGDLVDGGEWVWNAESKYAKYPVKISDSTNKGDGPLTAVSVPLRLGRTEIYVDCNLGGEQTVYKVSVKGRWTAVANNPKLSDNNGGFRVYTGNAAGYPIMMNGASLANDNQTYLFTYSKYRIGNTRANWTEGDMWVGANFSKWLEGSSYVMMPGLGIAKNHGSYNDVNQKFFDLSTDKTYSWVSGEKKVEGSHGNDIIGEVVVLMAYRANKNSAYYTDPGWECVNSGSTPMDGDSEFVPTSRPRNYNDYTDNVEGDSKYYGAAILWKNKNAYRESSPGISGTLSSDNYNECVELNYAYRHKFRAGDTISIYNPGNVADEDESYGLIIPIIKYYMPDTTANIKDVEAKYLASGDGVPEGGAVAVNVTTVLGNYVYGRKIMATYALYDENGALADVETKTQEATTTSDEFIFACGAGKAKFLNVIFANDEGKVIASQKAAINP